MVESNVFSGVGCYGAARTNCVPQHEVFICTFELQAQLYETSCTAQLNARGVQVAGFYFSIDRYYWFLVIRILLKKLIVGQVVVTLASW